MKKEIAEKLKKEAEKQYTKARNLRGKVEAKNKKGEEMLENIDAYLADYKYFVTENKLIEAFESVVWAWAWLEIGLQYKFLEIKNDK